MAKTKYVRQPPQKQGQGRVLPSSPTLIPVTDINEHDAFVCEKGQIMDIMQIPCKDLNAARDYDTEFDMHSFTWLLKSYAGDIKLVAMNYPVDVYEQVTNINRVLERTTNPVFINELEKEKYWLEYAHENFTSEEYYLMFFSEDDAAYKRNLNKIEAHLGRTQLIRRLRLGKKIQILSKMMNMNTALTVTPETNSIPRGKAHGKPYNPYLLSAIQPQGGVSFRDEKYIRKGDGYEACIHVYSYPARVRFNWMATLTQYENSIVTVDISPTDQNQTLKSISKSIDEQRSRYAEARHDTERFDAQRVYEQLEALHEEIVAAGEVVKRVHIRIFVFGKTQSDLDDRTGKILAEIQSAGYRAGIFLDEGLYEWKSLLLPATKQESLPNGRKGNSIPAETVAIGYPFHFAALADILGGYWGSTSTGGTVLFNPYHKDTLRLSYGMIVLGLMGSGKSTFLKLRLRKDAIAGNYIRGFATNTEFHKLVRYLGGSIIDLDGSDGFLNVLHVYRTDPVEATSFLKHIEKVCKFYSFLVPKADDYDLMTLQEILLALYKKHMGYDIAAKEKQAPITGREPGEYPILSDLLAVIRELMYVSFESKTVRSGISPERLSRYEKLELAVSSVVKNQGSIFDGHSSIRDFENEQIVFFNVGGLLKLSGKVFDAQMFSAMSLLWDNLLSIGGPQKDRFDAGALESRDARKYVIFMDEAHNFVNAKKLESVAILDHYMRESRKYFGGLVLATHKVTDFFPTNSSAEGIDAMHNLFSLSQYKVLFRQAPDSLGVLNKVFADELPGGDMQQIAKFAQGECILNITGVNSIRFQVDVTEEDLQQFSGGA